MRSFLAFLLLMAFPFIALTMEKESFFEFCDDTVVVLADHCNLSSLCNFLTTSHSAHKKWRAPSLWLHLLQRDFPLKNFNRDNDNYITYKTYRKTVVIAGLTREFGAFENFVGEQSAEIFLKIVETDSISTLQQALENEADVVFETEDSFLESRDGLICAKKDWHKLFEQAMNKDALVIVALRDRYGTITNAIGLSEDFHKLYPNVLLVAAKTDGYCHCCIRAAQLAHVSIDCNYQEKFVRNHGIFVMAKAGALIRSRKPFLSAVQVCSILRDNNFDQEK